MLPVAVLVMVTVGAGFPLAASWAGVNFTTVPFEKLLTQAFPLSSKAIPTGSSREVPLAVIVVAGVWAPPAASWAGLYACSWLVVVDADHRLPAASKASSSGRWRAFPTAVMVALGTGFPLAASWAGVNSTRVSPLYLATHRLPARSKASPTGP